MYEIPLQHIASRMHTGAYTLIHNLIKLPFQCRGVNYEVRGFTINMPLFRGQKNLSNNPQNK